MWTLYDAIALPGEPVQVLARCETRVLGALRIFHAGAPAAIQGAERFAETKTGAGGYASAALESLGAGVHPVRVAPTDAGSAAVWVLPADRTLIVTDLDRTVSKPTAFGFWLRGLGSIRPFPGAREALARAAERSLVVYLTARSDSLLGKTRAWLRLHGFPSGPVFCRHPRAPGSTSSEFKRQSVAQLKVRWPRIQLGIGDKALDARAYASNGVPAILFRPDGRPPEVPEGITVCRSWEEIGRFLEETSPRS